MFNYAPADTAIINEYRSRPACGPRPLTPAIQKDLEEANKSKKGGKRKAKAGPSEPAASPKKQVKWAARKPKYPSPVTQEESDSQIHLEDLQARNEHEDMVASSQPMASEPIQTNPEVNFTMLTSVPITDDFFQNFIPPLSSTATTTPITIAP